jgi:hypothetical protein
MYGGFICGKRLYFQPSQDSQHDEKDIKGRDRPYERLPPKIQQESTACQISSHDIYKNIKNSLVIAKELY